MEENQLEEQDKVESPVLSDSKGAKGKAPVFLWGLFTGMIVCALLFGLGMIAGKLVKKITKASAPAASSESILNTVTIQKLAQLEQVIDDKYYLADVEPQDLRDGMYKGMVSALDDPYSEYYTVEELTQALNDNKGVSFGIGAYISLDHDMDMAVIAGVMEGAPAQKAGLLEGDIIYKVDGVETRGMTTTQVVALVKGKENTTVHLTLYRKGEPDYVEVDVVRGKQIETSTIQYGMIEDEKGIGYIRITEFDKVTPDQFNEAMAELKANDLEGLILDLRSNPGGDLAAVTDIARRILPEGIIVYTEEKSGDRTDYTCDGKYEIEIPMAVLVNEYSASASEILAGAIQDYNKGTLIGTTTYGKGIVQKIIPFDDGTALKLTVSAYYTPSGRNIHGIGIEPDIILEYDRDAAENEGIDNQVQKAVEVVKNKIKQ